MAPGRRRPSPAARGESPSAGASSPPAEGIPGFWGETVKDIAALMAVGCLIAGVWFAGSLIEAAILAARSAP